MKGQGAEDPAATPCPCRHLGEQWRWEELMTSANYLELPLGVK